MVDPATLRERDAALAFIAKVAPDASLLGDGVGESYAVSHPGHRVVYLSAKRRAALREGDSYVTWMVTFRGDEVVSAESFSSRACSTGSMHDPDSAI